MRLRLALSLLLVPLMQAPLLHAQRGQPTFEERTPLVVWIVGPPTAPVQPRALVTPTSSAGMPDQTAGSYGQTLGSFGQTAGSYGQTSSSYGQTLAGFGTSLDNLPAAAARANGTAPPVAKVPVRPRALELLARDMETWQDVHVIVRDVPADELEAKLAAAGRDGPDVLLGRPLPVLWSRLDTGLVRRYGLVTLTATSTEEQSEEVLSPQTQRSEASILLAAPHPQAARAFVYWLLAGSNPAPYPPGDYDDAIAAGSATLRDVLGGTRPGNADPDYAEANPRLTRDVALGLQDRGLTDDLGIQINVLAAHANQRLAVLQLGATLEGRAVFGAVEALVILRKDAAGKWRTLQVTPSLRQDQLTHAARLLADFTDKVRVVPTALPLGISQAAPADGDTRALNPDLWWDNFGGATLQVVESQARAAGSWLGSTLFFVPDTSHYLRTQVNARFASHFGEFRWRVWSVAPGGTLTLSPWRTLRIVSR